jgi:hypothetical protein
LIDLFKRHQAAVPIAPIGCREPRLSEARTNIHDTERCGYLSSRAAVSISRATALAYVFVRLNNYGFDLYLVFFGVWCVLVGYLIFKSAFMPRVLGLLLMISGLGWMMYLALWFAISIFPFIAAASALGEIPLELWLLIKGGNAQRWREQAAAAAL